jgi:hypothetical protein
VVVEQLPEEFLGAVAGVVEDQQIVKADRGGRIRANLDANIVPTMRGLTEPGAMLDRGNLDRDPCDR